MTHASYRWAAVGVAACGAATADAHAATPTRAVLLDDFRIVEGAVRAVSGVVQITPPTGPATTVAARQVLFEGATRDDVYQFVAGKADQSTAAGLTQLAAWCDAVGMTDRAASHARAAAALAPTDAKVAAHAEALGKKAAAAKPVAAPPPAPTAFAAAAVAAPPADVPDAAVTAFGPKVQPILMNQCASCHARKDYTGAFKLARVPEGYANADATAANLRAAVAQLSRTDPAASPLIAKAVTAHGGQKRPAFAPRSHPAAQNLDAWVRTVVPTPAPAPVVAAAPPAEPARLPPLPAAEPLPGMVVSGPAAKPAPAPPGPPAVVHAIGSQPIAPPAPKPANPADPFDPAGFNALPKK